MAAHRYWRIFMQPAPPVYYTVGEIVFRTAAGGAQAATGGTVLFSTQGGNIFATSTAAGAFDGGNNVGWASDNTANQYLGYDFGVAKDIVEILLSSLNTGDYQYTPVVGNVQYSDDNITYTNAVALPTSAWSQNQSKVITVSVAAAHDLIGATTAQSNVTATQAVPTGTWTIVPGGEGASMNFASPTYLRYGADTRWGYLYASGTVTFNNTTFGDPASGTPKNGYYFVPSAGTITLTGVSTSQTNATSTASVALTRTTTGAASATTNTSSTGSLPVAGVHSTAGTTTTQANTSATGALPTPGVHNTLGVSSSQVNTSPTAVVSLAGVISAAATTQSATSGTSYVQIAVTNAPEPVLPQSFGTWLKDQSAIRCVLIEVVASVAGVETTRYLSNKPYVTGAGDTPSNIAYLPLVAGGVQFTESLSLDGTPSLSYGDIELFNLNGERDGWLSDIWRNRSIKVFMGDVRWTRSQFVMIFNGVVFDVDTRSRDRINLKLTDKLQRLNNPITDTKLGGTSQSKDRTIPLCFGECFNVEPLLISAALHEYQVHDGAIERIIEVRDNGVPVSFTEYLATGKFRLNQSPVGTITCSVQGDKYLTYITDVGSIIERIVTGYGLAAQRFTGADIDSTKLTAFKAANTAPVGAYINDRANVLDVCNRLASSVGARVAMSRGGLMYLVKIELPRVNAGTTVTASDMKERSLSISQLPPVVASVKVGYARNWLVEANIQTGIPEDHVAMFAQDWLTVTATDSAVATVYNLFVDPEMEETLLLRGTDAAAECNRRLALYKTQRKVVRYEGYPQLLTETLGSTQTVKHSRFGLTNGSAGQIISIQTDWLNPKVTVEVLI